MITLTALILNKILVKSVSSVNILPVIFSVLLETVTASPEIN